MRKSVKIFAVLAKLKLMVVNTPPESVLADVMQTLKAEFPAGSTMCQTL